MPPKKNPKAADKSASSNVTTPVKYSSGTDNSSSPVSTTTDGTPSKSVEDSASSVTSIKDTALPDKTIVPPGYESYYTENGGIVIKKTGDDIGPGTSKKAQVGPSTAAPWTKLPKDRRPPLLQDVAPQFPFDEGIGFRQRERRRQRLSWEAYARGIASIVATMRDNAKDEKLAVHYNTIHQSIQDDITEVLANNPDVVQDDWTPKADRVRTTHSYLRYSATVLAKHQADLEAVLGSGNVPHWGESELAKKKFGQNYPADGFREILHYKPQDEVPEGWRADAGTFTAYLHAGYWILSFLVLVVLLLAIYWGTRGGHPVWFRIASHVDDSGAFQFPSWSLPGRCSSTNYPDSKPFGLGAEPLVFKVKGTMKIFNTVGRD